MKNILLQMLVLVSMITGYEKVHALGIDDFMKPAVGIASCAVLVATAPVWYFISNGKEAERLKQKRLFLQEKTAQDNRRKIQEKQEKAEEAQRYLQEIQKEYARELAIVDKNDELTQEEYTERASAQFNHQTPFIHVNYARMLNNDIVQLSKYSYELSDEDREKVEALQRKLKKVFEKHNIVFKNVLATELINEQKALVEQQKLNHQAAARNEKLQVKKLHTQCAEEQKKALIEIKNQSISSIESVRKQASTAIALDSNNAQEKMNKMAEYAAAMHANNLAGHSLILNDIRSEITSNGMRNLTQIVRESSNNVVQLLKEGLITFNEAKTCIKELKTVVLQGKNETAAQKKESEKILKKLEKIDAVIERVDSTTAVMAADVGNIKSGNLNGEASAPPRDF